MAKGIQASDGVAFRCKQRKEPNRKAEFVKSRTLLM